MKTLTYNQFDSTGLKPACEKVIKLLENNNFKSAEVKKLSPTPYYAAKLDTSNRLLFKIITYENQPYILLLEIIKNHAYEKSRFLNGATIQESKILTPDNFEGKTENIIYLNPENRTCHILNKIISFDEQQNDIFRYPLPLIIIGSAGSGKTSLTLEKMKNCTGDILYVTHSPYLVQNARNLYYANQYDNEHQNIDFLSYHEFLETIRVPAGKEITAHDFLSWFLKQNKPKNIKDGRKLFEEFKGVITGANINQAYIGADEYCQLGIKQSIYLLEDRPAVYALFKKYLAFMNKLGLHDSNIVSHQYLCLTEHKYDAIIIDEVQDFTNIQIFLILSTLREKHQFLLSGDSNQIIHPNFFSWSQLKSNFYQQTFDKITAITRIITKNYRNTPEVTHMANLVLKIKNFKFGSIDKESHYLVEAHSKNFGKISFLENKPTILKELNEKTKQSTKFAIIVLYEQQKNTVKKYFNTPLVFSIHEAKGLEYENVILYDFVGQENKFLEIARGVCAADLGKDPAYARAKSKSDKSLEIYKFYINALYVGITRAVKNLYFVETSSKHPFLNLLGLHTFTAAVDIAAGKSSQDEWQLEANKLALQGKKEQAEQIEANILHKKKLPWLPINKKEFEVLGNKVFNLAGNKKSCLQLFEYALIYQNNTIIQKLKRINFKPAHKPPQKSLDLIRDKYFMFYSSSNTIGVRREIDAYGINFRNVFNLTPLMVAAYLGNSLLTKELTQLGADKTMRDNLGRTAYQIALNQCSSSKRFSTKKMPALASYLKETSFSIQVEQRMIKLDEKIIEFFLMNFLMSTFNQWLADQHPLVPFSGFTAKDIAAKIQELPLPVLSEKRKRRTYISSVLSRNEIARDYPYNRKLFKRITRGHYILNPEIAVKVQDNWQNIYCLIDIEIDQIISSPK